MDGLNSLGEGFWEGLTKSAPAVAQVIGSVTGTVPQSQLYTAQQAAAIAAANEANARKTSQYLVIGGIAVGALALLLYMRKQ